MNAHDSIERLAADNARKDIEIERLQDALKRIASGWPKPMQLAAETLKGSNRA